MRRRLAPFAEITGSLHEALAEMVVPDSIHHDPRGERIGRISEPARQFQPAAAFAALRQPHAAEHFRKAAGYLFAQALRVALDLDASVAGLLLPIHAFLRNGIGCLVE